MADKKKSLMSYRATRIWTGIVCFLLVLAIVANVLIMTTFRTFFNFAFGGPKGIYADGAVPLYTPVNSTSKAEAYENANQMNIRLMEEGAVLLKNEGAALPLKSGAKVSVFGKNSVNLSYGNSGSSGGNLDDAVPLHEGLTRAGFQVNPTLKAFYENDSQSGAKRQPNSTDLDSGGNQMIATAETPQSRYTEDVKSSYKDYSDAAIVVFTRIGGEGFDLPRTMKGMAGARQDDDHYLQLDQNETDLLQAVCGAGFQKVIVLLNIPSSMEAAFLTDPGYYAYQESIDACLWMGFPGKMGTVAVGEILSGAVNPSGHTVDTWARDFKENPTYVNFGDNNIPDGDKYAPGMYYFVDYEEGEYVGYRYWETRGYTDGEDWYREHVVFPFGYGLSYTTFEWEVEDDSALRNVPISGDETYKVSVKVTNTGSVAGKDVVQAYVSAPYTEGGIEKPYKVLAAFAKTELLEPGESGVVELTIDPYYFASYDYLDSNDNLTEGYELEAGDYSLFIAKDAHTDVFTIPFQVDTEILFEEDPVTGNEVINRYTDYDWYPNSDFQLSTVLSRSDWEGTYPDAPTDDERAMDPDVLEDFLNTNHNNPNDFDIVAAPTFGAPVTMMFRDLLPKAEADSVASYLPFVSYDDPRWEQFLDQCSPSELIELVDKCAYQTLGMDSVGVPITYEYDGPTGYVNFMNKEAVYDVAYYCSGPVVASTWNVELLEEFGETMGEEGIWGDEKSGMPYTGIYAPGVNIHRSPFGGRNGEYYSEDPYLTGKLGAAEVRGLQSRGVFAAVKHFAANDQETHRASNGDCSWLTEQSLREIYLKPFEIIVKEGGARAIMSSFNRIGTRWTGGDYRLLTEILREEWGFVGLVITDFNTCEHMVTEQMAYAGGDINLATLPKTWCDPADPADLSILRQNAKNVLYVLVNTNALNGEIIGYTMPAWQKLMYLVDGVLVLGILLSGIVVFRKAAKKQKAGK
ncbi:MAG: glycoside hydrolase family 3 C-terminal domain-containing protein [Clostridia bacterium]|nr:glycoside hydrolase family 3 C-terminal domain-containing protein [Clostridia bacterium]